MTEPYKSAAGVEAAIRDTACRAFAADKSMSTQERIRQEYFRRFLSRVFSEQDDSEWLLKGGTGVLARVASGRRTTDLAASIGMLGVDVYGTVYLDDPDGPESEAPSP